MQQEKKVLLNTKRQYMKESIILVGKATIKQFQQKILHNTKRQHMKELYSDECIVISNNHLGNILQSTTEICIYNFPAWQNICAWNEYN